MKIHSIATLVLAFFLSATAWAFDCPNRFADAQSAIDRATAAMAGMSDMDQMKQVHMLIDDAKMLLNGAKHNHQKPQHKLAHARAMTKAGSAEAYAEAAAVLASR